MLAFLFSISVFLVDNSEITVSKLAKSVVDKVPEAFIVDNVDNWVVISLYSVVKFVSSVFKMPLLFVKSVIEAVVFSVIVVCNVLNPATKPSEPLIPSFNLVLPLYIAVTLSGNELKPVDNSPI